MVRIVIDVSQLIVIFRKRALTLLLYPLLMCLLDLRKRACAKQEQVRGEGRTSGRQDFNHSLWIDISQWSRRRGSVMRERDVLH